MLYTLYSIQNEYESEENIQERLSLEQYLHQNYIAEYDGDLNFVGYKRLESIR